MDKSFYAHAKKSGKQYVLLLGVMNYIKKKILYTSFL